MKKKRIFAVKKIFILICLSLFISSTLAQRVLEVEESIKADIKDYVERVLPNVIYTMKVKVTPLKREQQQLAGNSRSLPFMDLDEEYIVDEWDNEEVSLYTLYSRIKKVEVELFVEEGIKFDNEKDFIDLIYTEAHLIQGRDTIKLDEFMPSSRSQDFNWKQYKDEIFVGILLVSLFIFGYLVSNIGLALAKKNIIKDTQGAQEIGANPNPSLVSMGTIGKSDYSTQKTSQNVASAGGDFFIQDPTKISETVNKKIVQLMNSAMFPSMKDMVILDNLAKRDLSSFSYLVYELPLEKQENVYSYGKDQNWFKGFSHVGIPGKDVLITLDLMLRDRAIYYHPSFERTLISLWRMGDAMKGILKDIPKEKAIKLLSLLPKQVSIPVARDLFPGSWGQLFDPLDKNEFLSKDECDQLCHQALSKNKLFNYEALKEFKDRKDLLVYLDTVGPKEEREIYSVLGGDCDVHSVRAPFYRLFDLPDDGMVKLKDDFSLDQWAIILFNVDHNEREKIVKFFDEKESYLFSNLLKFYGESFGDDFVRDQLELRKDVADAVKQIEIVMKTNVDIIERRDFNEAA